jgi:hypothetical protein
MQIRNVCEGIRLSWLSLSINSSYQLLAHLNFKVARNTSACTHCALHLRFVISIAFNFKKSYSVTSFYHHYEKNVICPRMNGVKEIIHVAFLSGKLSDALGKVFKKGENLDLYIVSHVLPQNHDRISHKVSENILFLSPSVS